MSSLRTVLLIAVSATGLAQSTGARVPHLQGATFAGTNVDLQDALRGKVGVLIIGFSRESSDAVAGWGRRLAAEYNATPGVVYFEMPVIAEVPKLLRGVVLGRIRASIPEPARPHFLPLTENEAEWKRIAGFQKGEPDTAYVLLVDGSGIVRWGVHRAALDPAWTELKRQAVALKESGQPVPAARSMSK